MKIHVLTYPPNELLTWLYEAERAHTSDDRLSRVFWYLSRERELLVPLEDANPDWRYNG